MSRIAMAISSVLPNKRSGLEEYGNRWGVAQHGLYGRSCRKHCARGREKREAWGAFSSSQTVSLSAYFAAFLCEKSISLLSLIAGLI